MTDELRDFIAASLRSDRTRGRRPAHRARTESGHTPPAPPAHTPPALVVPAPVPPAPDTPGPTESPAPGRAYRRGSSRGTWRDHPRVWLAGAVASVLVIGLFAGVALTRGGSGSSGANAGIGRAAVSRTRPGATSTSTTAPRAVAPPVTTAAPTPATTVAPPPVTTAPAPAATPVTVPAGPSYAAPTNTSGTSATQTPGACSWSAAGGGTLSDSGSITNQGDPDLFVVTVVWLSGGVEVDENTQDLRIGTGQTVPFSLTTAPDDQPAQLSCHVEVF